MVKGYQLTVEHLREELQFSRKAALADFRAEITTPRTELRQEIEAMHSDTTTSFQGLRSKLGEEIIKLCHDLAQVVSEHSLTV